MCTSSSPPKHASEAQGFTALELLVGVALTVLLVLGTAPLLMSLQSGGVREADKTVAVMQGRVAVARLERDLRTATGAVSEFSTVGPILEAGPEQVVLLGRAGASAGLSIIEWEITSSGLMRRWGPPPQARPGSFAHGLYVDHKSMMDLIGSEVSFSYVLRGGTEVEQVAGSDLYRVEAVVLSGSPGMCTRARVGR